jgi:hypothetical protein
MSYLQSALENTGQLNTVRGTNEISTSFNAHSKTRIAREFLILGKHYIFKILPRNRGLPKHLPTMHTK